MNNIYGDLRSCLNNKNYNKSADLLFEKEYNFEFIKIFNYSCDIALSRSFYDYLLWLSACGVNILTKQNEKDTVPFVEKGSILKKTMSSSDMYSYFLCTLNSLIVIVQTGNFGFVGDVFSEKIEKDINLYDFRNEISKDGVSILKQVKAHMLSGYGYDKTSVLSMEICGFDSNREVFFFVMRSGKDANKVFSLLNRYYLSYEGEYDFYLANQILDICIQSYKGGFDYIFDKIRKLYSANYQHSEIVEIYSGPIE